MLNGTERRVDEGELTGLPDAAVNVAGVYAGLRDAIRGGNRFRPDFAHAVRLTRLTDDVLAAAADGGTHQAAGGWPDGA